VRPTGAETGNDLASAGPADTAPDTAPDSEGSTPDAAVPERVVPANPAAGPARPPGPGRMLVRAGIAVVLAAAAAVGAWLLAARGVRTDAFPPFVAGAESTPITRYSGPWLTAAAAAALMAALLLLAALFDLIRWSRSRVASASAG